MQQHVVEININLKPSLYWLLLTILFSSMALIASILLKVFWMRTFSMVLVLAFFVYLLQLNYWQSLEASVKQLCYRSGRWWLSTGKKQSYEVFIQQPIIITHFVTIISFKLPKKGVRTVAIFCDSVDQKIYRRLKVLLRFRKA